MGKRIQILFLIFMGLGAVVGQSSMDFFHNGANYYVDEELQSAINTVEEGLRRYPDDPYLSALAGKLNEEQEQQQQQQQEQQQEGENEEQEQENQEQSEQESEEQQEEQSGEQSEEQQDDPENQEPQPQPSEMSDEEKLDQQEAEAILNALKATEENLMKKKYRAKGKVTVEKDW